MTRTSSLQVHDDLYNGLREEVDGGDEHPARPRLVAERVLNDALVEGMRIVGIDFRDGILFVPEVLLAANAMKGGMEILRPLLAETGVEPIGKMVIGTVKGDIHDIGKNLVAMMMEGAGFEVIDLGINNPVEKYLAALDEHKPDILGLSALLTTTMPYMKVVIDTMKDQGIRDDYIVLVGGAPLNEAFGKAVGADAYCRDAAIAVETAKALIATRRAMRVAAATRMTPVGSRASVLVIACGALAREIAALRAANDWPHLDVRCLPAELHNRPERIPGAVRDAIRANRDRYASIFVAYGDCGTGGLLDAVLREESVERIPGAHCYEFFAGADAFEALADDEPGTFYLTDFLLRHFDRLVIRGLGLDRHPELAPQYFGNYRRLVYPGAGRRARAHCRRARGRRAAGSRVRAPRHRLRRTWSEASALPRRPRAPAWQS